MVKRIGRYTIENELGRGAFGRVYRAFDPNLKIYVAIKVLIAEDDPELLIRFQAEARATAGLLHPNIVTLYEFSEEAGVPYLVMELLEGQTLQEVIGKPVELLDKIHIMYQVAEGLKHAHAKGVVHRDMKPGNIMVLQDGVTKILDFGIARLLDKDGTRRSRQGDFAGTIPYMAPELFHGIDADKLADIFAYGVIFYELLTGEQPFYAKDPGTVMYRITTYEPPPLRETVPEVPLALENLVRRLMAKERELRVDKMGDVVLDIQPVLQQLRQARAAAVAAEIRPLMESGDFDGAKGRIEQVLKLDPLHVEARQWREQLQLQSQRHALRARAEVMLRKGYADLEARQFAEAVQCFETAFKLDSSQVHAGPLVEQAKAMLGKARGAARLVAEAREELQHEQIDSAYEKACEAMKLDPGNREAVRLCEDLSRQFQERRTEEAIGRAEEHRCLGQHEEALAALAELEPDSAATPRVIRLQEGIEADRAEVERRKSAAEFKAALAIAREALSALRLQEAEEAAQALCSRFPHQPAAADLLDEVRERRAAQHRLEAIGVILQSARALIRKKRFEDARIALEEGLRSYPGDANLQRLVETANAMAAAQQRTEAIQEVVKQANAQRDNGGLEQALETVEAAVAQFGTESVLVECKRSLEFEREQRDYAMGRDRVLEEARVLLESNRAEEAVGLLKEAVSRYPGEPEVARTMASAHKAVAALREQEHLRELAAAERLREKQRKRERERALAVMVGKIETAIGERNWLGASASLNAALLEFPGEPTIGRFSPVIQEGRRRDELAALEKSVRGSISGGDLERALEQLASAREEFYRETKWQSMWQELEGLLMAAGDRLAETVGLLEGAAARHPGEPEVAQALDSAQQALAAWREQEAVRQAHMQIAALEAAGKLDEALAQAESEQARHELDAALAAAVRRLRDKVRDRERARGLAKSLKKIKACIVAGDWDQASEKLDAARAEFGADPALVDFPAVIREGQRRDEVMGLETRVRESLSRNDVEQAVEQLVAARAALSQAAAWQGLWRELERAVLADESRLGEALASIESLGSRHRGEPELQRIQTALQRLEAKTRARERAGALEKHAAIIQADIAHEDWDRAASSLETAERELGGDPILGTLKTAIQAGRRRAELKEFETRVRESLAQDDLEGAAQQLEKSKPAYLREGSWQELSREVERRKAYQAGLALAETAYAEGGYGRAQDLLRPLMAQAPDERAGLLLKAVAEQMQLEEQKQQRAKAITDGRAEAAAHARKGNLESAKNALNRLSQQFPDSEEIREDCEKVARQLEVNHLAAQAGALLSQGNAQAALDVLQKAPARLSNTPEIRDLAKAAKQSLEEKTQADSRGKSDVATFTAEPDSVPPPRNRSRIALLTGGILVIVMVPILYKVFSNRTTPVDFLTTPPGATVRVDGKECVAPDCHFELVPGPYHVVAHLDGYEDFGIDLPVKPGMTPQNLVLKPNPQPASNPTPPAVRATPKGAPVVAKGTLVVKTNVPGADIFIDGVASGQTDSDGRFQVTLDPKHYVVRVAKVKYANPEPQKLSIESSVTQPLTFVLSLLPALAIHGGTPGAEVFIDTYSSVGIVPADGAMTANGIAAGEHTIDIKKTGFVPYHKRIRFEAGQTVTLERAEATLTAEARPKPVDPVGLENQEWEALRTAEQIGPFQEYLKRYPKGTHAPDAQSRIDDLTWKAVNKNDSKDLRAFLNTHPTNAHATDAKARLDRIESHKLGRYDPKTGNCSWTGSLAAHQRRLIDVDELDKFNCHAPLGPLEIKVTYPSGVRDVPEPGQSDTSLGFTLLNDTDGPVKRINFTWSKLQ